MGRLSVAGHLPLQVEHVLHSGAVAAQGARSRGGALTTLQQPRAVRAINTVGAAAGRLGLQPRLAVDGLIAAATKRTGLHDFGGDDFREGLRVLTEALDGEARLTT